MEAPQPQPYEDKCNKHLQQTFNKKWEETNMKKKVLSALLTTAMLASMLVGCGSSNDAPAAASSEAAPAASTEAAASTEVAAEPASRGRQSLQHLLLERGVQEPSDRSLSRI